MSENNEQKAKILEGLRKFNLTKLELEGLEVPLYVKPLSISHITKLSHMEKEDTSMEGIMRNTSFAVRHSVCDKDGECYFTDEDDIAEMIPWEVAQRVVEIANGTADDDGEKSAMEKSTQITSSDSSSSSPTE